MRWWRDTPKRGETDARWCGSVSVDGHVVHITTGHATEADVVAVLRAWRGRWNPAGRRRAVALRDQAAWQAPMPQRAAVLMAGTVVLAKAKKFGPPGAAVWLGYVEGWEWDHGEGRQREGLRMPRFTLPFSFPTKADAIRAIDAVIAAA